MNLFRRIDADVPEPLTRRVRLAFVVLFLAGAGLRALAAFQTLAMVHPDEHQQFIEQAFRVVHGYGHLFWEQERGVRHPLYPGLLAGPLAAFEAGGVRDGLTQGALLRWTVSLFALLACTAFAWEFHRRGDPTAALVLMTLVALMPDVIYTHIHPLSETAATVPFLLALAWMDRRPFVSGLLLGLSYGIRFQMGFAVAATVFAAWLRNRGRIDRPMLKMGTGLALSLAGLCLIDKLVHGGWLHSPLAYYHANLVEGMANLWGVEPWYQYFLWLGHGGWAVVAPLAVLVLIGVRREWTLFLIAVGFVAPHLFVNHKEARFLLPIAPIMLALVSVGLSDLYYRLTPRLRGVALVLGLIALAAIAVYRFPQIKWDIDPYRVTAELLHEAGRQDDLTGVMILGPDRTECGNYFYLRRNVPLVADTDASPDAVRRNPAYLDGRINYLIYRVELRPKFESLRPHEVMSRHGYVLARLDRGERIE